MMEFNVGLLEVSYKQISIFIYGLDNPFNDWSQINIKQGFTYRSESIGIMTLNDDGPIHVNVDTSLNIVPESVRILVLPFKIIGENGVEIATLTESSWIDIPDGEYSLIIQLGNDNITGNWCRFSLINANQFDSSPRYLKHDPEISVAEKFDLNAGPA